MWFSFAIFSADWPIDSPVDGSAMAGDTGLTSRATLGTSADGTTCPKITAFTSAPSKLVRSRSSRATNRARSTARAPLSTVPDLQNGVRQPAITATRRPLATGITFSSRKSRNLPRARCRASWRTSTSETPFSHRTRAAALASMAAEPVDVLVIGGGVTGAGIARDAALRGFRAAVVDKGDLGGGTSSLSSRLIHGGVRYLEQGEFRLGVEASRERLGRPGIAPPLG